MHAPRTCGASASTAFSKAKPSVAEELDVCGNGEAAHKGEAGGRQGDTTDDVRGWAFAFYLPRLRRGEEAPLLGPHGVLNS